MRLATLCSVVVLALNCLTGVASAQSLHPLVQLTNPADAVHATFSVETLADLSASEVVAIDLPDGRTVQAVRQSVRIFEPGRVSWTGTVEGDGTAAFATHSGAVSGFVQLPGEPLVVVQGALEGGVHIWSEDDDAHVHHHHDHGHPHAHDVVEAAGQPAGDAVAPLSTSFTTGCDAGPTTDIYIVYTPAASTAAGGTSAILALIDLAIASTNQAYTDSGVDAELRLVGVDEIAYSENGLPNNTHLNRLQTAGDGFLDSALDERDVLAADLVSLIVSDEDGTNNAGFAFFPPGFTSVVEVGSFFPFVFAHEIGHNRGGSHELADPGAVRIFPFASAFTFTAGGLTRETIMNASINSDTILRFSNPDASFLGVPTGIANVSDNALAFESTLDDVNQLRCAVDTCSTGYDLGSTEVNGSFGFTGAVNTVWLNQFNVTAGANELIQLRIGFGSLDDPLDVTVAIWDDPNNDGTPDDATLIASFNPVQGERFESTLVNIPPTLVGAPGDSFFVGAAGFQPSDVNLPGRTNGPSNGRSWLGVGTNINTLSSLSFLQTAPNAFSISARGATTGVDCNANSFPDACDIADGVSLDANANGIPDECETACLADRDGDSDGDIDDVNDFLTDLGANDPSADLVAPAGADAFDLASFGNALSTCE
ncbi:MAG: reprolysin-like metallopeptidase [Planctomycetota bacterium]